MRKINRALITVSDKTGLADLGKGLGSRNIAILATGGTAKSLEEAGCKVTRTETMTGFADMLDGRVKTLHPAIHAGILARRDDQKHVAQLADAGFGPIDLVVVNLYPFEKTVAQQDVIFEDAVEQIDIGGVALIRSAAKNHKDVAVVVDPSDYPKILKELAETGGSLAEDTRKQLALKAFETTAAYDAAISKFFTARFHQMLDVNNKFPDKLIVSYRKKSGLRYGENPHQTAAIYIEDPVLPHSLAGAELISGKELSHNNYLDFDSALSLAREFDEPCCVVVKHRNPCGCAASRTLEKAIECAVLADPLSAFGGIVAVNHVISDEAAEKIIRILKEVKKFDGIIAPDYSGNAVNMLKEKKNMILLRTFSPGQQIPQRMAMRTINGGLLVQDPDVGHLTKHDLKVVSKRSPTPKEEADLLFAWKVVKHVVSNAIVFAKDSCTVGIGSGQVNRVGSVAIAARNAGTKAKGAVMASDAFFPFPDGVVEAAKAGITAAVQPGGSVKDDEVIKAANDHKMAMVMTGIRHFKH